MENETVTVASNIDAIPSLHSREAEEGLLGSVLINPAILPECMLTLEDGSIEFYVIRHKWIWDAFCELSKEQSGIDLITVQEKLERASTLAEIGGPAYLTGLINQALSSLNATDYAEIIHDYYKRRKMVMTANNVAESAYDVTQPIAEGSGKAIYELSQIAVEKNGRENSSLRDGIVLVDAIIEERSQLDELPGIPTKWIDLNKLLGGGAQKTDLNIIAGRPGQGKTTMLLELARYGARYTISERVETRNVVIFSLEMPKEQLIMRMISQEAEIDYQLLRAGRIPENKLTDYYNAIDLLASLKIQIVAKSGMTPSQVRAWCEIFASAGQLDMVCLDSLNLMGSEIRFSRNDQKVDYCATECKNIARDFDVPFWLAHQVNRGEGGDRGKRNTKPVLSDLREAGEQPADLVGFIYHEMKKKDGVDEDRATEDDYEVTSSSLVVAKQRNGPIGEIPLVWRKQYSKFENAVRLVQFT